MPFSCRKDAFRGAKGHFLQIRLLCPVTEYAVESRAPSAFPIRKYRLWQCWFMGKHAKKLGYLFRFISFFCYLCNMKYHVNWKLFLLFLFVAGGLMAITESFALSLGILLLLFVADYFVADYDEKRRRDKDKDE